MALENGRAKARFGVLGRAFSRALRDDPSPEDPSLARFPRRYTVYGWINAAIVLNFIIFVVVAVSIGGDALNGKQIGDRYFLWGNQSWGKPKAYWEVSRSTFLYSWWHGTSVFVTWPLAMFLGWRQHRIKKAVEAE
jgi:hypothetical protein